MADTILTGSAKLSLIGAIRYLFDDARTNVKCTGVFKYPQPQLNINTNNTRMGVIANWIDEDNYYLASYDYDEARFSLNKIESSIKTELDAIVVELPTGYIDFTDYFIELDVSNHDSEMVAVLRTQVHPDAAEAVIETELTNNLPIAGYVAEDFFQNYTIVNGSNTNVITVDLTGLQQDLDLYIKVGAPATTGDNDDESEAGGTTDEQCSFSVPAGETLWIRVEGFEASAYTLVASLADATGYVEPAIEVEAIENEVLAGLSSTSLTLSAGGQAGYILEKDRGG